MIKVKAKKDIVVFSLSGVLNESKHPDISFRDLENKKIELSGKDIVSWNTDFVVMLYNLLKRVPKENITYTDLPEGMKQLLNLAFQTPFKECENKSKKESFLERLGGYGIRFAQSVKRGCIFIRRCLHSWNRQLIGKAVYRKKDFWLVLSDCGPKAILIVSLISFMVGLILAFVGALQLKTFGAQIYVASLVTIGMTRIMGAIMTGIIMAGRTGASYAASIGTMQVNEELDALQTMGIPKTDFLVLPRMNALLLSMPILVLLSDIMGILGGCFVCVLCLEVPLSEYIKYTINSFDMTNFLVGVFHGVMFSLIIALCGCYFGIHCGRNADSVGTATTKAVVYAIVWMIIMTGFITLACEMVGI
ncbi:MAG: ABC transporter permease [Alphaproteobacteria bacterium]|nr:ABC transporter permease [Alphaproteobacteria bacterium]